MRRERLLLLATTTIIPLLLLGTTSSLTYAYDDNTWNLQIYLQNVPFRSEHINVDVYGPFSSHQSLIIPNSQNPQAFTVSDNDISVGSLYKVCASATTLGFFIPTCIWVNHSTNEDESVSISPN